MKFLEVEIFPPIDNFSPTVALIAAIMAHLYNPSRYQSNYPPIEMTSSTASEEKSA